MSKPSEPTTREEALSRADDWANGALSHHNELLNEPPDVLAIAVVDGMEALRYTLLAQTLPTAAEAELAEGLPSAPGPEYREAAEPHAEGLARALAALLTDGPALAIHANRGPLVEAREALTAWTRFENNRGRDAPDIVGKALLAVIGAVGQD